MEKPDFDTLADDYAKFRTSYSDELFDEIVQYAGVTTGGRILDLACGTGLGMLPYVRRGFCVSGVDVAPGMVDRARQNLPPDAEVEFLIGRAEALPFSANSFDLVSCAQAFHWFDVRAAFGECARVLKPGAALAIFWKHAAPDDPFTSVCEAIIREWLGEEAAVRSRDQVDEHASGWPDFWRFAAPLDEPHHKRPFVDAEKRIIEFDLARTAGEFVGYQRSRERIRTVLGPQRHQFLNELERRLRSRGPMDRPARQRQVQYLFLARRR